MPTIVLDGLNGSGTSTQSTMLKDYLNSKKLTSFIVRAPGSNDLLGKEIRKILKYGDYNLSVQEELMLFATDAISFYKYWIEQLRDEWIICDRSSITSMVYQIAKGASILEKRSILDLVKTMWRGFSFDNLFILDAPYEVLRQRIDNPNVVDQDVSYKNQKDNFESEGDEYLRNVSKLYHNLCNDPDISEFFKNIDAIDASKSKFEVFNDITEILRM